MTPEELPWKSLVTGGVDARRVNADGRWDWFWAVLARQDPAVILKLTDQNLRLSEPPELRNLEVKIAHLASGPALCIRLLDPSHSQLFATLCRDVIAATEPASSEGEAVTRALARTVRWHNLLRGRRPYVLTEEEQKGLIAEISVLRWLAEHTGVQAALRSWTGPSGAPKDFELAHDCVEVKARRSAGVPHIKINSEHQLAEVPARDIWLLVVTVDRVPAPEGFTLADWVTHTADEVLAADPRLLMDWESRLSDYGYDPGHDYSAWRWVVGATDPYTVAPGFPRIAPPIPTGVGQVTYNLALSACSPFATTLQAVAQNLLRGTQ
jgi:hypothetical protein